MKMKSRNAGYKGQGRRGDRPSGPRQHGKGGGSGGRPGRGHGGGGHNGHSGRRFGHNRGSRVGPTACPMCGAVVTDLGAHIRSRHDDPMSHPRD